jgi:hypothetical protein
MAASAALLEIPVLPQQCCHSLHYTAAVLLHVLASDAAMLSSVVCGGGCMLA